jgi:hypothetical protein
MDRRYHEITKYILRDLIHPELLMSGCYDYVIDEMSVACNDSTIQFMYDKDGTSKLMARTTAARTSFLNGKYLSISIPEGQGYLDPIPVAGRPVILWKEDYGYLQQVTFIDKNNKTCLDNTEYWISDGRNVIVLGYKNIDTQTLRVTMYKDKDALEADEDGELWEWEAVIDNFIYFIDIIPRGTAFKVEYRILDSFVVDYNEYSSINKATVLVHLRQGYYDFTSMCAYYEVKQADAWYHARRIEINPLYNPAHQGFLFLRDYENKPKSIELWRSPEKILADGKETRYFFVRALDDIGNPVGNVGIAINALHGKLWTRFNITNIYGIICVKYTAPLEEAMDIDTNDWDELITITIPDTDIVYREFFRLWRPGVNHNITVKTDELSYQEGEDITIDVKVFRDTLAPIPGLDIAAVLADYSDRTQTDSSGNASLVIPATKNYDKGYCRIKLYYGYQFKYVSIKVV